MLEFRHNIFLFIFAGVFCPILVPQPIHHWSLSQTLTFSLLHHFLRFLYLSYFWTFKSRNLWAVKIAIQHTGPIHLSGWQHFYLDLFNILWGYYSSYREFLVPSRRGIANLQFFLLFLFCWVLEILCNLNKVADRVKILFLCPQKYWPSYPTKIWTISAVVKYFVRYIYILNSIYIVLWDLYTCFSWVSIPKTQFAGLSYQIDFLGHLFTGTTNSFSINKL